MNQPTVMRPGIRILIAALCMLSGLLLQFVPGVEGWPASKTVAGALLLGGGVFFYLGCKRAARMAEKAYCTSRNSMTTTARSARQD